MAGENNDFLEEQRRAVERMNEMYRRQQIKSGSHPRPATPNFVTLNTERPHTDGRVKAENSSNNSNQSTEKIKNDVPSFNNDNKNSKNYNKQNRPPNLLDGILGGFNLPFKNGGKLDGDITLILGLLLILASEKADRKLLLALLYILM
ncbi:MAG: hypothetical protein E7561_02300 [Ruminococcaceae bacterium]|nr:hypothetical protein [Oscillospiraceae bacterium]